jgi:hypoxanthine phosphoribosyltransferase
MPELLPILSQEEIREKVARLAQQISEDYKESQLVLIGVLKGAFVFMADLVRNMDIPVEMDFIRASSYGSSDKSSGDVKLLDDLHTDIRNKDVLIVEDIVDTGQTVEKLISSIKSGAPKSIRVCAFIDKTERRLNNSRADYFCHCVNKGFLVGYGLDYAERYRQLPALYNLQFSASEGKNDRHL